MPKKGYKQSEQHKANISKAMEGKVSPLLGKTYEEIYGIEQANVLKNNLKGKRSPEFGEKMSKALVGRKCTTEHKINVSKGLIEYYKNLVNKEKHQKAAKKLWNDQEYAKNVWKGMHKRPTSIENEMDKLLQITCPNEFMYVGNGEFILGGKCPDFLNVNGKKKLIEVYGDYWHDESEVQERIDFFKKYGFDTLVIWEHEIRDESEEVVKKIIGFSKSS